jgi:hypothetical protein
MDRNNDGVINSGSELFGNHTQLANGQTASNGFTALAALDTNADGKITSADADWSKLKVWVDTNSDGVSQAGELHSLNSLGIVALDLANTTSWANNNGNFLGQVSGYQTADGATHQMADVWFTATPAQTASVPAAPTSLPVGTLSSNVGGLVQAMGAFASTSATAATAPTIPALASQPATAAGAATNVAGAVATLSQFTANGTPLTGSVTAVASTTVQPLNIVPPVANGVLATGK